MAYAKNKRTSEKGAVGSSSTSSSSHPSPGNANINKERIYSTVALRVCWGAGGTTWIPVGAGSRRAGRTAAGLPHDWRGHRPAEDGTTRQGLQPTKLTYLLPEVNLTSFPRFLAASSVPDNSRLVGGKPPGDTSSPELETWEAIYGVSSQLSKKAPGQGPHQRGCGRRTPPFLPSPGAGYRAPRLRVRGARLYWLRHVASVWLSAAPGICLLCLLSVCLQEPVSLFQLLCSLPALPLLGPILCGRS